MAETRTPFGQRGGVIRKVLAATAPHFLAEALFDEARIGGEEFSAENSTASRSSTMSTRPSKIPEHKPLAEEMSDCLHRSVAGVPMRVSVEVSGSQHRITPAPTKAPCAREEIIASPAAVRRKCNARAVNRSKYEK